MLEMAIVENIQRENLNAIEIALSYKRLIEECNLTQEALSEKISKQRTTVTNYLRLLKLPAEIQIGIKDKTISMGHARALINIDTEDTQLQIYDSIIVNELSVRQAEDLARNYQQSKEPLTTKKKETIPLSFEYQKISKDLASTFQTNVKFIQNRNGNGKIVIPFASDNDLKKILSILDI